jgi:hypothetical protein
MATDTPIRVLLAVLAAAPALFVPAAARPAAAPAVRAVELDGDEIGLTGNAGHVRGSMKPKVTAYFDRESYGAGDRGRLVVLDRAPAVTVQIFAPAARPRERSTTTRCSGHR